MSDQPQDTISLDGERDRRRQKWEWFAERCGRGFLTAVILAALLGLLGPGPLSHAIHTNADGSPRAQYYRIQRYQAPSELVIHFSRAQRKESLVRLSISRSFTDHVSTDNIVPEPESVELAGDQLIYSFHTSSNANEGTIIYSYQNTSFGLLRYSLSISDGEPVSLAHFVCP